MCICVHSVYLIILTVPPWHHIVKLLSGDIICWSLCSCDKCYCFSCCVLSPCANQWGWFCVLGSCHSLYCNVFFGVHNELSKPSVLFCFFLSPPSPLLLFPPYRLCVCHICYQGNGTECNQNHASLSDYGGTVPLSTYFSFPLVPSHTRCCPAVLQRWRTCPSGWCPFITKHGSFLKQQQQLGNYQMIMSAVK